MSELRPRDISPKTDNMVITCMDRRFLRAARQILKENYGVDIEASARLAKAGASLAVVDEVLIPDIQKSHKLHDIKNVYVVDHTDCGGFGGLEAFGNDEEKEIQKHFESLDEAKDTIHNVLPQLVVITFVVNLDGKAVFPANTQ